MYNRCYGCLPLLSFNKAICLSVTDAMEEAVTAASTAAATALLIPHLPPILTLLPPLITRLRALLWLMLSPLAT